MPLITSIHINANKPWRRMATKKKKLLPHDLKERKASVIEKHMTAFS
jgi:hypothetical protein